MVMLELKDVFEFKDIFYAAGIAATFLGFYKSVGSPLNLGIKELADVLHTFYLNVVKV